MVEACRAAALPSGSSARLASPWAGAWVDLLDELDGARVLVVDHAPGRAPARLAERAGEVAVVDDEPERAEFRRSVLEANGVSVASSDALLSGAARWDLIVLDGVRLDRACLARVTRCLAPEGRLVVVADNAASPLRALDVLGGGSSGPTRAAASGLHGALTRMGLEVRQSFALLRTSAAPVTAFDLGAPAAAAAVLQAAATLVGGGRRLGLRLLEPVRRPRVKPLTRAALLAPARLLVATTAGSLPALRPDRPTGRIGYQASCESKVVRGEPPIELEKRYVHSTAADAEMTALETLAGAGLAIAPRLVARPAPDRLRMSWLSGRPLEVAALADDELEVWVSRAARLLARIHHAVGADAEGRTLVHGDYWLGNLLHEGERIVAVVDWTTARWGDPRADLAHLVDSLVGVRPTSARVLHRLTTAAGEEYAARCRQFAGERP